ncbi:MAG: hypothetical protein AABZ34_03295 [Nitrospirota bacterium]
MAHASRLPRTWLPAVFVSVIVSACCAAALYALLAQHDRSLVTQRNAAMLMAAEQSARALARTLAWFSESLGGEQLAAVQQTLEQHAGQANLLDAAVITTDNMIVAASNAAAIGTPIQDAAWPTARNSQSSSITHGVDKGRPVMIVVEPFRQDNRIAGWIRLVVATPPDAAVLRSEEDLGRDVALVIGPLLLVMVILLTLTMRGLMSRVRALLAGILMEAGEQRFVPVGNAVETPDRG